jgi:hypothetical protein|tara:strand:- start:663 stop:1022 length:360 start_codon:yes stop_codon:yes gene_type:complete
MGLDFQAEVKEGYAAPRWRYSSFNAFRKRLATEIGLDLYGLKGFCEHGQDWPGTDDIEPLLNHSDCDGELAPLVCAVVAPRLQELMSKWEKDSYDYVHGSRLMNLMVLCANEAVPLEFR